LDLSSLELSRKYVSTKPIQTRNISSRIASDNVLFVRETQYRWFWFPSQEENPSCRKNPTPFCVFLFPYLSFFFFFFFFYLSLTDNKMQKLAIFRATRWLCRSFSGISSNPLRVCVVGSGPAGFYTAEKVNPNL